MDKIRFDEELQHLEHRLQNQIRQSIEDFIRLTQAVPNLVTVSLNSHPSILRPGASPTTVDVHVKVQLPEEEWFR